MAVDTRKLFSHSYVDTWCVTLGTAGALDTPSYGGDCTLSMLTSPFWRTLDFLYTEYVDVPLLEDTGLSLH